MMEVNLKEYLLENWNSDITAVTKDSAKMLLDDSEADKILLKDFIDRYTNCTIEEFSFGDVLSAFYRHKEDIKSQESIIDYKKSSGLEKKKLLLKMYGHSSDSDDSDDYLNF